MRSPVAFADLEVHLPLPAPRESIRHARHWRSTWLISSIQTLKELGHFERYRKLLAEKHADAILTAIAGVWLPIDVARAHYAACDALGLSRSEQVEMGRRAGERGQKTVIKTAVLLAGHSGVTPWTAFSQMQRLWERGADGGGTAVYKVGPKEALAETIGCELLGIPYFRIGYGIVVWTVASMFCTKAYMHDVTPPGASEQCLLRFQWA